MNFVGFSAIQRHVMSLSAGSGGSDDPSTTRKRQNSAGSEEVVDNRRRIDPTTAVPELSDWITRKSGVQCQTDEASLKKFLRNCNYDVNKAKRRIAQYYDVRMSVDKWFLKDKLDPSDPVVIGILRSGILVPCHRDLLGHPIIICRLECFRDACDLKQAKLDDVIGLILYIVQHILKDRQTRVCSGGTSVVAVMDFRRFGVRGAALFTPKLIKNIVTLVQDSIPCHLKAIHIIDAPAFLPTLLKSFLRTKMKNRVHVHGPKLESGFHDSVPPECLPAEYGGTQGNMQQFIDALVASIKRAHDKVREDEEDIVFDSNDNSNYRSMLI